MALNRKRLRKVRQKRKMTMSTALIIAGVSALALGSWMKWHPAPVREVAGREEAPYPDYDAASFEWGVFSRDWGGGASLSVERYFKLDDESFTTEGLTLEFRPYYAKNLFPRTWAKLSLASQWDARLIFWSGEGDDRKYEKGSDTQTEATLTVGDRTIGPFMVPYGYYTQEPATYDKKVVAEFIEALRGHTGPVGVKLEYYNVYSGRMVVHEFDLPETDFDALLAKLPEAKLSAVDLAIDRLVPFEINDYGYSPSLLDRMLPRKPWKQRGREPKPIPDYARERAARLVMK